MNENNPPPAHQSTMYLRKQNNRAEHFILTFFCWILTLGIWTFTFLLIDIYSKEKPIHNDNFYKLYHNDPIKQKLKIIYLIVFLLLYIIYLILELTSPIFKFLCNKQKKKFSEKIKSIFQKFPSIKFKSKSKIRVDEDNCPINSKKFKIFSSRDVSGLLALNSDSNNIDKKKYVFLKLKEELILEDEKTFLEYKKIKEDFIRENRRFDKNFQIEEEIKIKGLKDYYMIKLKEEDYYIINKMFFLFFTFIAVVEFYKIWINYLSIYQEFTIKKIISSHKELNNEEKYDLYNPQINSITNYYTLPQSNFYHLHTSNINNKFNNEKIKNRNSVKQNLNNYSYRTANEDNNDQNGGNFNADGNKMIQNPYINH